MTDRAPPPWPAHVRARVRRCRRQLASLRRTLLAHSPDALALARDPSLAERIDTTPYDHDAAEALLPLDALLAALDDIASAE